MPPPTGGGRRIDSGMKCGGSFLCLSANHERPFLSISYIVFSALERTARVIVRYGTRIENSLVANVLETCIDEERSVIIDAEQLYGNVQRANPLMRRFVLPVEINHRGK